MAATDPDRVARAALSRIADPETQGLGAAVAKHGAPAVWAAARGGHAVDLQPPSLARLLTKNAFLATPEADLSRAERVGARLVCPQDDEWPAVLGVLGENEPLALWVRGEPRLDEVLERSVAVVGARAATSYGGNVASDFGYGLAGRGWTVVSGGAYGIDALAHRGALSAGCPTVAVLACGVDVAYPQAHDRLFARVVEEGLLVSEWPPGTSPRPHRFLIRNRVIAAMTAGTVVVEAAIRSGALSTGRRAAQLGRSLMVVPGPVTSTMSAGCHLLLREEVTARVVTTPAEVVEEVGRIGDDLAPRPEGEQRGRDSLSSALRGVVEAVPSVRAAGPGVLAQRTGLDLVTLRRSLGELICAGFVELTDGGYRLSAQERAAVRARAARFQETPSA